ncbi:hypothetical protein [Saccharothrix variisporea]|uniref:Uncharacterized protein n=1 Tax=Saccharothrix variisporea TaxID=543527 RepID=A0A495X395_9PSEU|nr:hypothetical protein [Saccharothrix variisporea]RKT68019.1 hypothetical protein DFJ66_1200 [Saccharothrix variisporea]
MTAPEPARPFPRPRISKWAYVFCGVVVVGAVIAGIAFLTKALDSYPIDDFTGRWTHQDADSKVVLDIASDHTWKVVVARREGRTRCFGRADTQRKNVILYLHEDSKNDACGTAWKAKFTAVPSENLHTLDLSMVGGRYTLVRER